MKCKLKRIRIKVFIPIVLISWPIRMENHLKKMDLEPLASCVWILAAKASLVEHRNAEKVMYLLQLLSFQVAVGIWAKMNKETQNGIKPKQGNLDRVFSLPISRNKQNFYLLLTILAKQPFCSNLDLYVLLEAFSGRNLQGSMTFPVLIGSEYLHMSNCMIMKVFRNGLISLSQAFTVQLKTVYVITIVNKVQKRLMVNTSKWKSWSIVYCWNNCL